MKKLSDDGVVTNNYTLKKLKELCPPKKTQWYSVTVDKLKELISELPNKDEIKDIQVSEFGEIRVLYHEKEPYYPAIQSSKMPEFPDFGYIYDIAANAFFGDKPKCHKGVLYSTHHITPNYCLNTRDNLIYIKQCEHKFVHNGFLNCSAECKECNIYKSNFAD